MHQPAQAFGDIPDPSVQRFLKQLVALPDFIKDDLSVQPFPAAPFLAQLHQRRCGGIAFKASPLAAGAVHAVRPQGKMPHLPGDAPPAAQQASAGHHAAAHAGSQGNHDHIAESFCPAGEAFSQHRRVRVVQRPRGRAEGFFHQRLQIRSLISGNLSVRADYRTGSGIHLPAGGYGDALRLLLPARGKPFRFLQHRLRDRRPVSVKGYAGICFFINGAVPVRPSQLDFRAADIDRQNHFTTAINRAAISSGRVIAPPTTTAQAPISSIFFACSGVCTRPSAITGQSSSATIWRTSS